LGYTNLPTKEMVIYPVYNQNKTENGCQNIFWQPFLIWGVHASIIIALIAIATSPRRFSKASAPVGYLLLSPKTQQY
jgi:hypothetical protein